MQNYIFLDFVTYIKKQLKKILKIFWNFTHHLFELSMKLAFVNLNFNGSKYSVKYGLKITWINFSFIVRFGYGLILFEFWTFIISLKKKIANHWTRVPVFMTQTAELSQVVCASSPLIYCTPDRHYAPFLLTSEIKVTFNVWNFNIQCIVYTL